MLETPDPYRGIGLVRYHGSIAEYLGQVFQTSLDPEVAGRLILRSGATIVLRHVREASVTRVTPGRVIDGVGHWIDIR